MILTFSPTMGKKSNKGYKTIENNNLKLLTLKVLN